MRALALLPLLLLIACPPVEDSIEDPADDPRWEAFLDAREQHLTALSEPIAACVPREDDLNHPVFSGCWDWHSAVHGTWSLLVISRLTADESFADVARSILDPLALDEEITRLEEGGLTVEVPYGMAWALLLGREAREHGETALTDLGAVAEQRLRAYVAGLGPTTIEYLVEQRDYQNLSWALLQLLRWYEDEGDTAGRQWVEDFTRDVVLTSGHDCTLEDEEDERAEFFPACLHLARLVVAAMPPAEAQVWVDEQLPDSYELTPLTEPTTAHSSGLDFSRSWGLYDLHTFTGRQDLRTLYLDHVETWLDRPEYWAEDYANYSHWVAQFGVHAIAMTDPSGTP